MTGIPERPAPMATTLRTLAATPEAVTVEAGQALLVIADRVEAMEGELAALRIMHMGDASQHTTGWEIMRNGQWIPATEVETRDWCRGFGIRSDIAGVCSVVMGRMWAEIDRHRAEVAQIDDDLAHAVNDLAAARAELAALREPAADEALVEVVARLLIDADPSMSGHCAEHIAVKTPAARAVLAAVAPKIRAAERERIEANSREVINALEQMKATHSGIPRSCGEAWIKYFQDEELVDGIPHGNEIDAMQAAFDAGWDAHAAAIRAGADDATNA